MTQLSKHASDRCQQRSVPPVIVEWLLDFGSVEHDHRGAEIRFFDERSRKRLASEVGEAVVSKLADLLDAYLVVKDETVLTVGYRFKRINHH